MPKFYVLIGLLMLSENLLSQNIKTEDLIGEWMFDKDKILTEIDFKDDSIIWNSDTKLNGKYSLKYINNETVISLDINTGGYAWLHEIYLIRRFPYGKFFMLQIPKTNKKGHPIIEWQKHYEKDEYILTKINPEDRIKK